MTAWEAILLGVVQGLTEFFPVSSSGHLVLTEALLGLSLPGVAFEVALHVATLVSVLVVYRVRLWSLVRDLAGDAARVYIGKLVLATVPAVIAGLLLKDWFEARFDDPRFAGTMLLVTGSVVWSSRWALGGSAATWREAVPIVVAGVVSFSAGTVVPFVAVLAVEAVIMGVARVSAPPAAETEPGWWGALQMGVAQAVAILPGISRSGSTVLAGLWRRVDAVGAAEFSFLMSIPAILGAAVLSLPDLAAEGVVGVGSVPLALGSIAAGVSGVIAIRFFVAMLRRRVFHGFAVYCWIAAAVYLLVV